MAQVTWSVQAWDELAEVNFFLMGKSQKLADYTIDSILEAVDLLKSFPNLGRVVPELNVSSIRELVVKKYRVVYLLKDDKVEIITIRPSSRPLSDGSFFN